MLRHLEHALQGTCPARGLVQRDLLDGTPSHHQDAAEVCGRGWDLVSTLTVTVDLCPRNGLHLRKRIWIEAEMEPRAGPPDVVPGSTAKPPPRPQFRRYPKD